MKKLVTLVTMALAAAELKKFVAFGAVVRR